MDGTSEVNYTRFCGQPRDLRLTSVVNYDFVARSNRSFGKKPGFFCVVNGGPKFRNPLFFCDFNLQTRRFEEKRPPTFPVVITERLSEQKKKEKRPQKTSKRGVQRGPQTSGAAVRLVEQSLLPEPAKKEPFASAPGGGAMNGAFAAAKHLATCADSTKTPPMFGCGTQSLQSRAVGGECRHA